MTKTDPRDLLTKHGITLKHWGPQRTYVPCPKCSAARKGAHKKATVLGVTVEADGAVRWGCNHCAWSGPAKGDGIKREPMKLTAYIYRDRNGVALFRKVRNAPGRSPRFWMEQPDGKGWKKGTKGVNTEVLYRANEVATAIKAGHIINIVEGEKDCDNLARFGMFATCNAHGASERGKEPKWTTAHSEQLRGADIVVLNDNDDAGRAHADAACRLSLDVAKRIRCLDLALHWEGMPKGADVSDWIKAGHNGEELAALIDAAPVYVVKTAQQGEQMQAASDPPPSTGDDAELLRLAKLPIIEYERERKAAADALGMRTSMLDRVVEMKRHEQGLDGDDGMQGKAVSFPDIEPWDKPVVGETLLNEIADTIRCYVVLADHMRDIAALWVVQTYIFRSFRITPSLSIRSPTKGCGKSTLLEILAALVNRPLQGANITPAALFRLLEKYRPTLLIDEADAFVGDNNELRGVLDATHKYDGNVIRTVGDDYEPRVFNVFAPLAFAGIGTLPATLTDRALTIDLQRRLRSEKLKQLSAGQTEPFGQITRRIVRWLADNADRLAATKPVMPECLLNRFSDNWLPLLTVAEVAGEAWKTRAHQAVMLAVPALDGNEEGRLEMMLADIRRIFDEDGDDRMASDDLVEELVVIEGRPWAEYGRAGKPLTKNGLARLLSRKPLSITPQVLRIADTTKRGYYRDQFEDAWSRYLPEPGVHNRNNVTNSIKQGVSGDFTTVTAENPVTVQKTRKPYNTSACCGVAVVEGEKDQTGKKTPSKPPSSGSNGEPWKGLSQRAVSQIVREMDVSEFPFDDDDELVAEVRRRLAIVPPDAIDAEIAKVMQAWRDR